MEAPEAGRAGGPPGSREAGGSSQVVDWAMAVRVAGWLAARRGVDPSYDQGALQASFEELVPLAERLVVSSTGLEPRGGPARARVTDRREWTQVNVASFQRLLGPSLERLAARRSAAPVLGWQPIQDAGRVAGGVELGAVLAWLSGRVLGQYDLLVVEDPVLDDDLVYFVGPNVVQMELRHGFPSRQFRLWLALHEVTHRVQFTAVPWLRSYFLSLVDEGLEPLTADPRRLAEALARAGSALRSGKSPLQDAGVLGLVATPEQLQAIRRIQALMSLLEGHGDVTMSRAGASEVPSADRFAKVLRERREQVRGPMRLLQQILGIEAKLRQYAEGARFIRAVEEHGGPELLAQVWRGPELLPSVEEIRDPSQWVHRVTCGAGARP